MVNSTTISAMNKTLMKKKEISQWYRWMPDCPHKFLNIMNLFHHFLHFILWIPAIALIMKNVSKLTFWSWGNAIENHHQYIFPLQDLDLGLLNIYICFCLVPRASSMSVNVPYYTSWFLVSSYLLSLGSLSRLFSRLHHLGL